MRFKKKNMYQEAKDRARAFGKGLDRKQVVVYTGLTILALVAISSRLTKR